MIKAIGTDICSMARMRKNLAKQNAQVFIDKIFTKNEQDLGNNYKDSAQFYAGRWAAKEAVAKCLGTGFDKNCRWLDIDIRKDEQGAPFIKLSGATLEKAISIEIGKWHLSLTHEKEIAVAFVIAESLS